MDSIVIEGLRVSACIGATDAERRSRQELVIDLAVQVDLAPAGRSDELADTVDYADLLSRVRRLAAGSSFHLLEALAEAVASELLAYSEIRRVEVGITKPALSGPDLESVGIRIARGR